MSENTLIGKPEIRVDAWSKVTGQAEYVADFPLEDVHFGYIVRSPHPHASIRRIDPSKTLQMKGVLDVITIKDVPGEKIVGDIIPDRPVLAWEKVRLVGEPIAIVVATSKHIAEHGGKAVEVEYQPLVPVFDPIQALEEGAPRVHASGNLVSHIEVQDGDTQAGFQQADMILEETFHVPRIYPGYLEPEAAQAQWNPDGSLTVWVSSQKPFHDRHLICQALGLPEEKVIVRVATVGGAFGGKEDSSLAILAALAAWKTKTTVRLVNTREESLLAHPKRHSGQVHYKAGFKKDGTLVAMQITSYLDTGAYASYGPAVGQLHSEVLGGPYKVPNVRVDTYVVYTNSPIAGAMRGFGAPQANFGTESLMDIAAGKLGIHPIELRRKNIWRPGDRSYTRVRINQAESLQLSLDVAEKEYWRLKNIPPAPGKVSGVGLSLSVQTMGLGYRVPDDSAHALEWLPDGRVRLYLGAPELGQGLMTVAAQITADALGLSLNQIEIALLDTSQVPDGGVSCASRMTYSVGNAAMMASRQLIQALIEEAARLLEVEPALLHYEKGHLTRQDRPDLAPIPASEITSRLAENGQVLKRQAVFSFPYGPETPDHLPIGMPHVLFCFGAHVIRVEVDLELGTIEPKEIVAIHDVGKIINRATLEGQVEGAISMGLGYALLEEMKLKPDGTWVDNLTEYLLPTIMDIPPVIKVIFLEVPEESGPHGAKGIGEMGLTPVASAVANAIYDATGVRVKAIPIRPEMIIKGK